MVSRLAMVAGEVANQAAEATDVIEKLLINAAFGTAVGFAEGLFGAGCVAGPQPCEGQLAQQRRSPSAVPRGLLEVLHLHEEGLIDEAEMKEQRTRILGEL